MAERYREKELGCYSRKSEVIKNITAKAPDNTVHFSTADSPSSRQAFVSERKYGIDGYGFPGRESRIHPAFGVY
jgi:hypothetical protein